MLPHAPPCPKAPGSPLVGHRGLTYLCEFIWVPFWIASFGRRGQTSFSRPLWVPLWIASFGRRGSPPSGSLGVPLLDHLCWSLRLVPLVWVPLDFTSGSPLSVTVSGPSRLGPCGSPFVSPLLVTVAGLFCSGFYAFFWDSPVSHRGWTPLSGSLWRPLLNRLC